MVDAENTDLGEDLGKQRQQVQAEQAQDAEHNDQRPIDGRAGEFGGRLRQPTLHSLGPPPDQPAQPAENGQQRQEDDQPRDDAPQAGIGEQAKGAAGNTCANQDERPFNQGQEEVQPGVFHGREGL